MKRLLFVITLGIGSMLFGASVEAHPQPKFHVEVLPLQCLFDVVDAGSNQVTHLSPEVCNRADQPLAIPSSASITPVSTNPSQSLTSDESGSIIETDKRNIVDAVGDIARAGAAIIADPLSTPVAALAVVPIVVVLNNFLPLGSLLRRVAVLVKKLILWV